MNFTVSHPLPLRCCITVRAPESIFELMRVALCGWEIKPEDERVNPMIEVFGEGKLRVVSASFVGARPHSDLINTLNDVFIALAYCVRDLKPNCDLVHAAALKSNDGISIYFGARKSGKSRFVAEQCIDDKICIADDLLLYCKNSHLFESLGLPVRLRRPVHASLLAKIDSSKLLVGHSICYFTEGMCKLMPAGQAFSPDTLFELQPEYKLCALPLIELEHRRALHVIV